MNKEISFRSNLFESKKIEPHFINDRCFGEDLANWLIHKLNENHFSLSKPYQEDWGWEFEAKKDNEIFFIQIGIMDESIGKEDAEWQISIEKAKSWFSFGKQNSLNFENLCREIAEILRREPQISEVTEIA
jgi:hypothetical protein